MIKCKVCKCPIVQDNICCDSCAIKDKCSKTCEIFEYQKGLYNEVSNFVKIQYMFQTTKKPPRQKAAG